MNTRAFIMGLITVIIWGSTFAAIRASLDGGYPPGHLVLFRYLIASSLFAIYACWPGVSFRLPSKNDIVKLLFVGWIGISVYHFGVTFGEQTVSAGTAGMLIGSAPIFTAIIAVLFLKEKLGRTGWIGLSIGFGGIVLITLGTSTGPALSLSTGALLILMSAIATSLFFVLQKSFLTRYSAIELTAYVTWAGTIPFFLFSPGLFYSVQHATLEATLAAVYTGIFPAAIAYVTWAVALSLGNASSVASMMYIEPAVAVLVAWIWLQELPSFLSLLGGVVALTGVIITNIRGKKVSRIKMKT